MGNVYLLDSDSLTAIKHYFLYFPYLLGSSGSYQIGGKNQNQPCKKMNAMGVTKCDVKHIEKTRMGLWSSGVPHPYRSPDGK